MKAPVTIAIARRDFLKGIGLLSGGLALGIFPRRSLFAEEANGPQLDFHPNAFIDIAPDGAISIYCSKAELGQGVRSSLPVLVADEMGADLARIRTLQAGADAAFGDQSTGGSSSVYTMFEPLRRCGAVARVMLIAAAAKRWQVPENACDASGGFVRHRDSGREIGFGELAADAAQLPVPDAATVSLRTPAEWRYIGKPNLPLVDAKAILNGSAVYAGDVAVPGMAVAVIVRPPVFGGSVAGFDAAAALAVHGVKAVLALPQPSGPPAYQPVGGVAVVGENTWAAIQGRLKLTVSWNHGANATYDSDADRAALLQAVAREGKACRDHGDVAHALGLAARTVEAAYFVPHLAHTPMEPPVTLAHFANGSCEVWSCTQNPQDTQAQVAATVGVDPSKVTVHATLVGGAFGRKSIPDYAAEAAWLSLKLGIPVRVQWTRDDDIRQDCYHAISAQQMTAGLDETGRVIALRHRTAFPSLTTLFMSGVTAPSNDELSMGVLDLPLATENFRTETCDASPHLRIGWVRSVANIHHAFAIGSFFDEIAAARGMDPRESLLDVLGPPRKLTSQSDFGTTLLDNYGVSLESHPIDVGRYHGVIERVTAMAGWSERHRDGRALGLAVHRCFLTYVAAVVSVKQRADGFWADEIWMAADVGTAVNPERVRAQMESAAISGLSLALYGGITVRQGAVQESNFHEYRIVRIGDAPTRIHVQLIASTELPGGAGEPGVPPIAPALCNAIFAATGKRIRELPIAARGGAAR